MTTLGKATTDGTKMSAKVKSFFWHLAQMILVMGLGMMIYHKLVLPLLEPYGYTEFTDKYPLFGYWMMVISMTLPMLALMRLYHKSTWRYSLGMTFTMLAPLAALTVLVVCSLLPMHALYGIGDPLMIVAMAVFLIVRPHQHAHAEQP